MSIREAQRRSLLCEGLARAMAEQWTADLSTDEHLSTGAPMQAKSGAQQQ